jgi:hypothetical protein
VHYIRVGEYCFMRYASYKILGERYSGLRVASSGLLVMQTGTKSEFKMIGEILFEINGPCQIGKSLHLLKSFKLPRSQIHSDSRQGVVVRVLSLRKPIFIFPSFLPW